MKIEVVERDEYEPKNVGKLGLYINWHYEPDAHVTLEELIELRCEIDKYLFLRLAAGEEV